MVAHRIILLRKEAGMNQAQLAEKLNVSTSAVGMYEQGRRYPNMDMLVALANIFDCSLDYLVTGKEYPESKGYRPERMTPETCPCTTCFWKKHNT